MANTIENLDGEACVRCGEEEIKYKKELETMTTVEVSVWCDACGHDYADAYFEPKRVTETDIKNELRRRF